MPEFDWSRAAEPDEEFDWANAAAPAGVKPEHVSTLESFGRGVRQGGSLGFADEMGAGLQSNLQAVANALPEGSLRFIGIENYRGGESKPLDVYRDARDENRREDEAARAEDPGLFLAGELAGSFAVPVPGAQGASVAARVGNAALKGAGIGAAYGLGASDADLTTGDGANISRATLDTMIGGVAGGAGGALGQSFGEVKNWLAQKAAAQAKKADLGLDNLATERVGKEMKSAGGDLGTVTQKGSRAIENLMRAEQAGQLTAQQMADIAALKASGQWDDLVREVAQNNIDDLPGVLTEIRSRRAVVTDLQNNKQQAFTAAREEVANPMAQITPRVARYAAPIATALLGPSIGFGVGMLSGGNLLESMGTAALGAGVRPSINAVKRMVQHPAVRKPLMTLLQHALGSNPNALGRYAKPLALAASKGEQELAVAHFVLAQQEPEYREMMGKLEQESQP